MTLALGYDIDAIANKGKLLATDWQKPSSRTTAFALHTSTIVFLVRKGNPKGINVIIWGDITRPGRRRDRRQSQDLGGARWAYSWPPTAGR